MTLSDLSIKRPVFAWMIMFGLIFFGTFSFFKLGISQMPDVDFPVINVQAEWEGAAPEIMESEIADGIEQEVIGIDGVQEIETSVQQGRATVVVYFDLKRDIDVAMLEVQSKVSEMKFPLDVKPPRIQKQNADDSPIIYIGISSEKRDLRELSNYVEDHLKDQFQTVDGVGELFISGGADRNLRIWPDAAKLKQYDLTVLDIRDAVEGNHSEASAGFMETPKIEYNLRVLGEGASLREVEDILITQRGGRPIYNSQIRLRDVARVEDGMAEVRRISRVNGKPGMGIGIRKVRGANAVQVGINVRNRIEQIKKSLPEDIHIQTNFDSTTFIKESVEETEFTLILSAIITGLVCWLFLGSWSSTFNVLLSIPTSIIGTFMVIYFCGFTLNFFTLLALSLAVGIVVDDAIMVLENIVRHHEMGKSRLKAATDGAREITFAAVAASVAVIAIFVPIVFMPGIMGKFLYQFGVTLSVAVALSLLEAITLTPMRCSQFLQHAGTGNRLIQNVDRAFEALSRFYLRTLKWSLEHKKFVMLTSLVVFVLSMLLIIPIGKELVPKLDMRMMRMTLRTPTGSSLEFTSDRMKEVEKMLDQRPEIDRYFLAVGGFGGADISSANMFVTLKPYPSVPLLESLSFWFRTQYARITGGKPPVRKWLHQKEMIDYCNREFKKIDGILFARASDLSTRGLSPRGGNNVDVEFNIRGGDYEVLRAKSEEIMKKLDASPYMENLESDYRIGQPELEIIPDRERAARSGVSMEAIGEVVQYAIGGARAGKYTQNGRRYDVRIRLDDDQRQNPEAIKNLLVRTEYGQTVPLGQFIQVKSTPKLQSIQRRMRQRAITIQATLEAGASQAEALKEVERVCKSVLPEGYTYFFSGTALALQESNKGFLLVLGMGIVVAYMVLASQFNSFIHPFTVLLALPFSLSGALIALIITGNTLNLYSGIGLVLLMGIVKKNSILLVEFTNQKRYDEGMSLREALLTACPIRLRPIMMTSMATLAAALPPALALGPGAESRIPMAVAVIGGVTLSTALTLFVIPCAYESMAKFEKHRSQSNN